MPHPADSVAETAREFGRSAHQRGAKPQTLAAGTRSKTPAQKPVEATTTGSKSEAKSAAFVIEAHKLGWDGHGLVEGDTAKVTVQRGGETIDIEWLSGVFTGSVYSFGGRTVKLNNASAAKQRMNRPAEAAVEEVARVNNNRNVRNFTPKAARRSRELPFNELSLDDEVILAVEGHKITWVNSVSGEEEYDLVPEPRQGKGARPTHTKITEGKRGRTLTFVGMNGFHDVLVSAIVEVS